MTANIRKSFSGRWYYVSTNTGLVGAELVAWNRSHCETEIGSGKFVSIANYASRSQAVAAAKKAGHLIIIGE